jgi:hypothetical protein
MNATRILILGGYGTFGGRIVELLQDEERLSLIVAGRSLDTAQEFCARMQARAKLTPARFDRNGEIEPQLRGLDPNIVVDASGPFQAYGDDPYRVVKAAIALKINYLDLADGSDFVEGIAAFNAAAKAANIYILSGVSSFPVLTAAVVRKLAEGMSSVDSITGGIAPSPYAGVGLNVIKAIASYSGKPVAIKRGGEETNGVGFAESLCYTIAPPGKLPLQNIRFSLVDVPDLKVLTALWPSARTVWMGAGPVPEILHRALNTLAKLVSWKIIPSLVPLAPFMHFVTNNLRWGEDRGGMFVEVKASRTGGAKIVRSWHLLAEGKDGPLIPSMAVEAIVRNALAGRIPKPGARAAVAELEVADYEDLFKHRQIYSGEREETSASKNTPLYAQALGECWHRLPTPIQNLHDFNGSQIAEGVAIIERGKNPLAILAALIFGFPKAGRDIPVKVEFREKDGVEYWTRTFGGKSFSSKQQLGRGRDQFLVRESFGPFRVGLANVLENDRLKVIPRYWSFLGIPLPRFLLPRGETYEHAENNRFNFHVEIGSPLTGLIVRYKGWLVPSSPAKPVRSSAAD